jgi:hypothetical protein
MFDVISIVGNIVVIIYLLITLFTGGLDSLSYNYIFIGYLVFTTLTIPLLISKTLFKQRFVSFTTALLYLYFPVQFLFTFLISRITGFSLGELLPFYTLFNLVIWNIFFILFILNDEKRGDYSEKLIARIITALIPGILFSLFSFIFIRQTDSVVALDYLQHLTVPNRMFFNNVLCLVPGECSNLFLQHGYTTFYHIILGNFTTFLGTDPARTIYIIDILYPLICSIPIFYIFKDITKSTVWAQVGTLLSLLVFVMGGYDFVFFIPQTFTLYLFLMIYREKKLSRIKLGISTILLVLTHFVIGTYLSAFLWIRELILKNIDRKKEVKWFYIILFVSILFFALANIAGFSFEKLIQADQIEIIGSLTNPYYPNNLNVFWQILGPMWLFVLIIFITNFLESRVSKVYLDAITYIAMITVVYFLAPTYANKFTTGVGFFSVLLVIKFLSTINMNIFFKSFVFTALIVIIGSNFYVQYNRYLSFYTQEDGTVSAITKEDRAIVEYLNTERTGSLILSDPYTQLIVAALTNTDTVQAQYMSLGTRENLLKYMTEPTPQTYEDLISSEGIPRNDNFDVLYTSRIYRAINNQDNSWMYNIYSLSINNTEKIEEPNKQLINEMERVGRYPIYISDNFILFR